MLSVSGISKTYPGFAIEDISFDVQDGEYFVLLGKTGVGKSVLLEVDNLHYPAARDVLARFACSTNWTGCSEAGCRKC